MGRKKGKKNEKMIDGLLPSEMSRPQLLGFITRLQAEFEKERDERNYFMLEREKLFQMWNLIMEQIALEKEKAALFDSHLQDVEKMKENEDNLYDQKLRFLKEEHTRKLGQVRLHHLTMMKHVQDDLWGLQMVMKEALMEKKAEVRQLQMALFQIIRGLHWKHARDVSDLRKNFAREIRRLETVFDRRLFEDSDRKEEEQEKALAQVAGMKEDQIQSIIDTHRAQTDELTTFFRELIRHNMALICSMKEQAKKEKTLELRAKRDYEDFKAKYEEYIAPAVQWRKEMIRWAAEHRGDDDDSLGRDLLECTDDCKRLKHLLRMVECSNEALYQRTQIALKEKACLNKKFSQSFVQAQKITSMSRFIGQLKKNAAKREGELYESLADNVEKNEGDDNNYFEAIMSPRDRELEEMAGDITENATEHKNVEDTYKYMFYANEIHLADIGFPIKKTGAKAKGTEEDLLALREDERSSRSRASSLARGGKMGSGGRGSKRSIKGGNRARAASRNLKSTSN